MYRRNGLELLFSILLGVISTVSFVSLYQAISYTSWIVLLGTFIIFTVLYAMFIRYFLSNLNSFVDFVKRPAVVAVVLIFSLLLWTSLRSSLSYLEDNNLFIVLFVYLFSYFTIVSLVLGAFHLLVHRSMTLVWTVVSRKRILWYALPSIIIFSIYLMGFFPGNMSPDSMSHWRQVQSHEFSNWHPVMYTWYMILLTSIWESPAIIALSQIVILSLILGYGMYRLERSGVERKWLWLVAIIFAIFPINGVFSIILWKDILFNAFLFLFTILIYNIVSTKGKWMSSYGHLVLLGATVLGVSFLRNNGLPIFIVMAILLIIAYRSYWKQLLVTLGVVAGINFVVTGPIYEAMDVKPANPNEVLSIPTQQFGKVIQEDGELTAEQQQYLGKILPLETWKKEYYPYLTDSIKFHDDYNSDIIFDDFGYYLSTWAAVLQNNVGLYVGAYLDQTSLIWQINQPEDGYTNTFSRRVYQPNEFGMETTPVSTTLHDVIRTNLERTEDYLMEFIWRPATYTFFILLTGIALFFKSGVRSLLIILPVFLNAGTILLALPAQDFRYQYANFLIAFLMAIIGFITLDTKKEKVPHE
ncbi:DUF6020 family protein [Pontibacillus salicampi]|uniref:DUF6020 family protein n=1 Tax=Pontibacillus salicampi TaxID=1449801 RepID=A0ABV6LSS1_9BACI